MAGKQTKKQNKQVNTSDTVATGDNDAVAVVEDVVMAGPRRKIVRREGYGTANVATGDNDAEAVINAAHDDTADGKAALDAVESNTVRAAGHGIAAAKEIISNVAINREEDK